jgi:hypothetical protein
MKYRNLARQRNLLICLALVAKGHSAMANNVFASAASSTNSFTSDVTITFATPVANADELLTIAGGTISGPEYSTFTIDVDFATGSPEVIDSASLPAFTTFDLSSIANKAITLPNPSDTVTGLEVIVTGDFPETVDVPRGTQFTFDTTAPSATTPEPSSLTMLGTPLLAAPIFTWLGRRRRSSTSR